MSLSVLGGLWRDVARGRSQINALSSTCASAPANSWNSEAQNDPIVLEYLRKHPQADA